MAWKGGGWVGGCSGGFLLIVLTAPVPSCVTSPELETASEIPQKSKKYKKLAQCPKTSLQVISFQKWFSSCCENTCQGSTVCAAQTSQDSLFFLSSYILRSFSPTVRASHHTYETFRSLRSWMGLVEENILKNDAVHQFFFEK